MKSNFELLQEIVELGRRDLPKFSVPLTPELLGCMISALGDRKSVVLAFASSLYSNLIGNTVFYNMIDPINDRAEVMLGNIGHMLGTKLITDAYCHPDYRILNKHELYVVAMDEEQNIKQVFGVIVH